MYGSNKHLTSFLKPIINKVLLPDAILVCHSGHDWPAVGEWLDVLVGVVHGEEY